MDDDVTSKTHFTGEPHVSPEPIDVLHVDVRSGHRVRYLRWAGVHDGLLSEVQGLQAVSTQPCPLKAEGVVRVGAPNRATTDCRDPGGGTTDFEYLSHRLRSFDGNHQFHGRFQSVPAINMFKYCVKSFDVVRLSNFWDDTSFEFIRDYSFEVLFGQPIALVSMTVDTDVNTLAHVFQFWDIPR